MCRAKRWSFVKDGLEDRRPFFYKTSTESSLTY